MLIRARVDAYLSHQQVQLPMQLRQLVEHLHPALDHVVKHSQPGDQVWQLSGRQMDRLEVQN